MRRITAVLAATALLALAGCYTADAPLLTDDNSVAPYAKITFTERGTGDAPDVMEREGKVYVDHQVDGNRFLRFMAVRPDWYIAEMSGKDEDGAVQRLYALVHLDVAKNTAETYASVGDETDAGPGLRVCEAGVCIEDLAAYIAHATAKADAGGKPDTVFDVTVE
jgi:hypothetical protein